MNILHFSWDTKIPGVGGSTHEWNMAKSFEKLGNNVRLVCEWDYDNSVKEVIEGIDVRRVFWRTNFKFFNPLILLIKGFSNSFFHIKDFSPSVIYERYRIFGGYGVIVGRLFGKKTILEVNDPTIEAPFIEGKIGIFTKFFASIWERFVFSCASKIVAHHEIMTKRANPKKVSIITNGVNTSSFNPKNFNRIKWKKDFFCLFIGVFAKWQGYNTIINAAKKIKNKNVKFVFVGANGKETKNVKFLGRINYDKIPEVISNSDICLYIPDTMNYLPMKELGFYFSPLKLFEYMSMGKPVIVSDVGNLKKLVKDGINGYRIKPNDSEELIHNILKLYNNKTLVKRMGENNRKECLKKYDWIKIAENVLK